MAALTLALDEPQAYLRRIATRSLTQAKAALCAWLARALPPRPDR